MLGLARRPSGRAEDPTSINPVVPDELGEIFWGAVAFFALWILMRYWLLPPLMRIREQRRAKEIADLEAAEAAKVQAEQVRRDYDATLAEARAERGGVLEAARAAAESRAQPAVGRCGCRGGAPNARQRWLSSKRPVEPRSHRSAGRRRRSGRHRGVQGRRSPLDADVTPGGCGQLRGG